MKRLVISLLIVLGTYSVSLAQTMSPGGIYGILNPYPNPITSTEPITITDLTAYPPTVSNGSKGQDSVGNVWYCPTGTTINSIVMTIGATQGTLVITEPKTLGTSLTIPPSLKIKIENGGSIVKASTYTLTIKGPFEAGLYQVFSGFSPGDVTFGSKIIEVYPNWWGSVGDGATDDTIAIKSAIAAIPSTGGKLVLPSGTYRITSQVTISKPIIWESAGSEIATLKGSFSGTILRYDIGLIDTLGGISANRPILTVGSVTNITPGITLAIRGAGIAGGLLVAKVLNVVGTTVTLDTSAGTTVANAPVRRFFIEGNLSGCGLRNIQFSSDTVHTVNGIEIFSLKDSYFKNIKFTKLTGDAIIFRSFNQYAVTTDEHHSGNLIFENITIDGGSVNSYTKNGIITKGASLAIAYSQFKNLVLKYLVHSGINLRSALRLEFDTITSSTIGGTSEVLDGGFRVAHTGLFTPRQINVVNAHFDTISPSSIMIEALVNGDFRNMDYSATSVKQLRNLGIAPQLYGNNISTTGTISANSNSLVVASAKGIVVNTVLVIKGAAFGGGFLVGTVTGVSGTKITLDEKASVAVEGAATYSPAGIVANIIEDKSYHALPAPGGSFVPYVLAGTAGYINNVDIKNYRFNNSDYTPVFSSDGNARSFNIGYSPLWSNGVDVGVGYTNNKKELVKGGEFNEVFYWAPTNGTIASVTGGPSGNCLKITREKGSLQYVSQTLNGLTNGHLYKITFFVKTGSSGDEPYEIWMGNDRYAYKRGTSSSIWSKVSLTFLANSAHENWKMLFLGKNSSTAGTMFFANVSVMDVTGIFVDGAGKIYSTGGVVNHAACWKNDGTIGYCSAVVDANGVCGKCN